MLQTKLKSGYIWEYKPEDKGVEIVTPLQSVFIPKVKVRSLLCFLNRVAWHRERKHGKK